MNKIAGLIVLSMMISASAHAAGGSHVIDDAGVETPGVCHSETWITTFGHRQGFVNVSPACTFKSLPNVEFGGSIQRVWSDPDNTLIGPTIKINLIPVTTGVGVGIATSASWNVQRGQTDAANVIIPVTLPLNDRVQFHFNAGWSYNQASVRQNAAFYGAQTEIQIAPHLTFMAEVFRRDYGDIGSQVGLRWNPDGGRMDIDLLAGTRVDGVSAYSFTLGVTLRH